MPRVKCKDCGKAFVASGKNVVVCPACVDKRLGKPAPKAPKRRPKTVSAPVPVPEPAPATLPAPDAALAVLRTELEQAKATLDASAAELAQTKAALDASAAELAQAKADLMDANAEAARLWREKRLVEERLRKAELRLKMLKVQEVAP